MSGSPKNTLFLMVTVMSAQNIWISILAEAVDSN